MGASWPSTLVSIGIVALTVVVVSGALVEQREARRLADLGPCGLAQAYLQAPVAEDAPCGSGATAGAGCTALARRGRAFAQAARIVAERHVAAPQAELLERLAAHADAQANGEPLDRGAVEQAVAGACPPP